MRPSQAVNLPAKNRASILVELVLVAVLLSSAVSASDSFRVDGYYKNFSMVYDFADVYAMFDAHDPYYGSGAPMGSVSSRLRLNSAWWLSEKVSARVSYDLAPRIQDRLLFFVLPTPATLDPQQYRVTDFDSRLYPECGAEVASFAIFHNLDRASLTLEADRFDLYVGRQPIAFGSARVVNPTDLIAPFSYEALDTEDRVGVDAVRARVPIGFMGEVDVGCVFGEDFEPKRSACFLRTKGYVARTDLSLIVMGFRENLMIGMDVARSIGGAGFWLEAAQVFVRGDAPQGEDYFSASAGLDYSFANNTYVFAEYHFNQAGSDNSEDYLDNLGRKAYTDGSVYLLGRHYITPGVTWEFSPLIYGSLQLLTNLSDQSVYVTPSVEYNVAENIYLGAGAFIGLGDNPDSILDIDSEFGFYPDIFFTSFRIYF